MSITKGYIWNVDIWLPFYIIGKSFWYKFYNIGWKKTELTEDLLIGKAFYFVGE